MQPFIRWNTKLWKYYYYYCCYYYCCYFNIMRRNWVFNLFL